MQAFQQLLLGKFNSWLFRLQKNQKSYYDNKYIVLKTFNSDNYNKNK